MKVCCRFTGISVEYIMMDRWEELYKYGSLIYKIQCQFEEM